MPGHDGLVTIFLGGDVMTGRGVDQILAHPGDPRLWEPAVRDARTYVRLAEEVNGPIPRPVDDRWPWGDALEVLDQYGAQVRIVNLETSITARGDVAAGKSVHYRMAPANGGCLTAARLDAVALANNHVLDFGRAGLVDTLDTLVALGIATAGAGRDATEAARPAILPAGPGGRVVMVSLGSPSSGIPPQWMATGQAAGVDLLSDLTAATVRSTLAQVRAIRQPGDIIIVSVHWGSNWGYDVPGAHVEFAHRLIDGGVDIVHGHSSHHPRPVEIYQGKLILYGCGDLIDDYEGIRGYERYRDDLRLLYLTTVDPGSGRLAALRMVPLQARQMRLYRAGAADTEFLCRTLTETSPGLEITVTNDGTLELTQKD